MKQQLLLAALVLTALSSSPAIAGKATEQEIVENCYEDCANFWGYWCSTAPLHHTAEWTKVFYNSARDNCNKSKWDRDCATDCAAIACLCPYTCTVGHLHQIRSSSME